MSKIPENDSQLGVLRNAYLALEEMQSRLAAIEHARTEPIAIIGIGCHFPGQVQTPEDFWHLLQTGTDATADIPPDRWDVDAYYDPAPEVPGKMYTRRGSFLTEVDRFDAPFFNIAPREAGRMDPQQRLLLEVTWEALESAALDPASLVGSQTGVFVGISNNNDYLQLQMRYGDATLIDAYCGTGNASSIATGRLSYMLGLQGPNIAVDTACSSSLVAVHLACQSLRAGECQLALAGGVNLILSPETTITFSKAHMLSADGRCKTFDAAADGYGRGEGCGVVVLKRLSDAQAHGDPILALIRGSAVNQDGPSGGITVPNGLAQQAVIRQALTNAGVEPAQVSYVEAHGTGTPLGDPIEVRALAAVLGQGRPEGHPLTIGSVKTNIGHLEAAAGIASLIKVVLGLQHEEIPPHLHLKKPNPYISWAEIPVSIPTERTPWQAGDGKRIAGISSFGFSGTNAHVILAEAPQREPVPSTEEQPLHLLTLSAKSAEALQSLVQRWAEHLQTHPSLSLTDVCFTANTGRSHLTHRLAIVGASVTQMHDQLTAVARGEDAVGVLHGKMQSTDQPEIAFLFTGQGSQYLNMGRQLYETQPLFRQTLSHCDQLLRPYLQTSLLSVLYPEAGEPSPLDETAFTQPALFAVEYALATLWRSWGIEPTAVLGHSVGEYVAACVAGIFSLEDGLKLIAERARLMQALSQDGAMVAVAAAEELVAEAIAPYRQVVSIAALNGPQDLVISGALEAVERIQQSLRAKGIKTQRLRVSHAFHSPLMEPMLAPFTEIIKQVTFHAPQLSLVSNLTGELVTGMEMAEADYWCRHTREAVRYWAGMQTLQAQGYEVFVEIGPGTTLLGMGRKCVAEDGQAWLPSLRKGRDDWQQLQESLAGLYVCGVSVDWMKYAQGSGRRLGQLPTYPWQRERYWLDETGVGQRTVISLAQETGSQTLHTSTMTDTIQEGEQQPLRKPELVRRLEAASPGARKMLLVTHIQDEVARVLGLAPSRAPVPQQGFFELGMDSLMAVELGNRLQTSLGLALPSTLAFDYPNIDALAVHVIRDRLSLDLTAQPGHLQPTTLVAEDPIAIIGMGCRFPGGANEPEAFWQILRNGVDGMSEVPPERWNVNDFYDPDPDVPRKMYTRYGGFLDTEVDKFDAQFFGITPREAVSMDPQQRLLLEVSWEALENAGQALDKITGSPTGVFVGINTSDYMELIRADDSITIDAYVATGNTFSVAAGRLSYSLGLQGPCIALDTACSSSLVTVHLACQSLRKGECNMALAGGVNLMLSPGATIAMSKLRALSPDGHCKTFDAAADGYGRGEGCGVVVLKRLSDAVADRDPILALIRGSAVNQDGRSSGLTVPNGPSQQALLRQALTVARIEPAEVSYVDAHGTGTPLGDPIELQALNAVMSQGREKDHPLLVGSVKTNIGHLEAAAGVAGMIKVILALQHEEIPPHLHLKEPSPYIRWDEIPLSIPAKLTSWPSGEKKRVAGVSSFGFSGTNAHVVLEEAPRLPQLALDSEEGEAKQAYLLPLSARSPQALRSLARKYLAFLAPSEPAALPSLQDICYTASLRRTHHDHRLALVRHSHEQLAQDLAAFLEGVQRPHISSGHKAPSRQPRLVFVFSGQGPQWLGMGRSLLQQEPTFRAVLLQCDQLLRQHTNDWSLLDELLAEESRWRLTETELAQPALFAFQIALVALWRSWGIEPDAVIGHSLGEVAAAYVAGILSLEDAIRVIFHRSRLMHQATGQGKMAQVELPLAQVEQILEGYQERLSIAAINSPTSTVLSGEPTALAEVLQVLRGRQIRCRELPMNCAFHSYQIEPFRSELEQALQGLAPQQARRAIFSTVTGQASTGEEYDAYYWGRNMRETVRFAPAVEALLKEEAGLAPTFIEISPHPVLGGAISQCLYQRGEEGNVLGCLHRDKEERGTLLEALGKCYSLGYSIDWAALYLSGGQHVPLPTYAWQRERYWIESKQTNTDRGYEAPRASLNGARPSFLSRHFKSARSSGEQFWEIDLSQQLLPYLTGHQFQGILLLPSSIYIEIALATAKEAFGAGLHVLEEITVHKALVIPKEATRTLQLILTSGSPTNACFEIFSLGTGNEDYATSTLQASGKITIVQYPMTERRSEENLTPLPASLEEGYSNGTISNGSSSHRTGARHGPYDSAGLALEHVSFTEVQQRCLEEVAGETFYQSLQATGLALDGSFRAIEKLWRREGEALGEMRLPEAGAPEADSHVLHPALLAACFQLLAATVPMAPQAETFLPMDVASFRLYDRPGHKFWSHALLQQLEGTNFVGDVRLLDQSGRVVVEALGLRFRALDRQVFRQAVQERTSEWLYDVVWQSKPHVKAQHVSEQSQIDQGEGKLSDQSQWLIFADQKGLGTELATLLGTRGQKCLMVFPGKSYECSGTGYWMINPTNPEDFQRLLRDILGTDALAVTEDSPRLGLVYLWSLETEPSLVTTLSSLEEAQVLGCGSVLHLVQALARIEWRIPPHLWLVSRGVQPAGPESRALTVAQAPLWGLGKVVALEHPDLWGGLIDLDHNASAEEAQMLFAEIWEPDGEDQIAFRGQERYVSRLVRSNCLDNAPQSLPWRSDGTYLITGGLGSLGLKLASWMVAQGARHVILTGRHGLPDRSTWGTQPHDDEIARKIAAIQAIEATGAIVQPLQADVAELHQMSAVLAPLGHTQPPLRGIIHAAGLAKMQAIQNMDLSTLNAILRPKVIGTWVLHQLTQGMDLDFFLSFSSAASVWGSAQSGHYVAANHFLDIFAHHRHALGLPASSINWGWWEDSGMVPEEAKMYFAAIGLQVVPEKQGFITLEYLLAANVVQTTVAMVDWSKYKPVFEVRRKRPFLEFIEAEPAEMEGTLSEEGLQLMRQLKNTPPSGRVDVLVAYIRADVARIMGLDPSHTFEPDQGLFQIGMDSLMAVELKTSLQTNLGHSLPPTIAFEYPTIEALAGYLASEVLFPKESEPLDEEVAEDQVRLDEAIAELEGSSEDDLISLLANELTNIDKRRSK